ncbi:MAG: transglutaminase-like domain-containing protein [Gammaproteobacteria bacterium]|nr:transglutaminase-like domain-containing protein [Gammaproteobacteria bacterium]
MAVDREPAWQAPPALAPGIRDSDRTGFLQLAWLGLLIVSASLPHWGGVHTWVLVMLGGTLAFRLAAAGQGWPLPGRLLRGVLTLAGAFAVVFSYRRISGLDAGSALLILMLALKLLETRTARDRSIVILIAWFVLFAGFLREQSVASVPQLLTGVVLGTLALLQSTRVHSVLPAVSAAALAGRLLGQAVPLALILFVLFPRLPGPFWALPSGPGSGQTGLSDQINPGDISELAQSDAVAFRVRFFGAEPKAADLYFRGPVLERFDGRRWRTQPDSVRTRGVAPARFGPVARQRLPAFDYEITLEPHRTRWLLPLEVPVAWEVPESTVTGTLELLNHRPVDRRLAWRGRSAVATGFQDPRVPGAINREVPGEHPRTAALAATLRLQARSDADYLARILHMFRTEAFYYTLEPPALGAQPLDEFLFITRSGFCEHYASAFAALARLAGIPARVVAGYQGGERNPLSDYWIVRQSDAHAWTEVWLDGRWQRFDPTGAVAPERIEGGLEAALPESVAGPLPLIGRSAWFGRMALSWDAVNAAWDRWVLAFGPDQQAALLETLGFVSPSVRDIALVCAAAFGAALLVLTLVGLRRHRVRRDPVEEAWQRLCRSLAAAARPRAAAEGPLEYARAAAAARPDLAPAITALAAEYLRLRYEGEPSGIDARRFSRRVRALRVPPVPVRESAATDRQRTGR